MNEKNLHGDIFYTFVRERERENGGGELLDINV